MPMKKLFCMGISPATMQFVHGQAHRVTANFLETPFLFVERKLQNGPSPSSSSPKEVDAYCLAHPQWPQEDATLAATPPSRKDIKARGFMRMVVGENKVRQAYDAFKACPVATMVCEVRDGAKEQRENARLACIATSDELAVQNWLMCDPYIVQCKDARFVLYYKQFNVLLTI